jgi:hypothetical protein
MATPPFAGILTAGLAPVKHFVEQNCFIIIGEAD